MGRKTTVPISGAVAGRRPATSASELAQSRRGLQQAPLGEATPSRRPLLLRRQPAVVL
jgi:hypothetical protein